MRTLLIRHPGNASPLRLSLKVTRAGVVVAMLNPDRMPEDFAMVLYPEDARTFASDLWAGAEAFDRAQFESR